MISWLSIRLEENWRWNYLALLLKDPCSFSRILVKTSLLEDWIKGLKFLNAILITIISWSSVLMGFDLGEVWCRCTASGTTWVSPNPSTLKNLSYLQLGFEFYVKLFNNFKCSFIFVILSGLCFSARLQMDVCSCNHSIWLDPIMTELTWRPEVQDRLRLRSFLDEHASRSCA